MLALIRGLTTTYPRQNKAFARALAGGATAFLVFSALWIGVAFAANAANIDQCANGQKPTPVVCAGAQWQNGNLNAQNSHYGEGDTVPYRIKFTGLATTGAVT